MEDPDCSVELAPFNRSFEEPIFGIDLPSLLGTMTRLIAALLLLCTVVIAARAQLPYTDAIYHQLEVSKYLFAGSAPLADWTILPMGPVLQVRFWHDHLRVYCDLRADMCFRAHRDAVGGPSSRPRTPILSFDCLGLVSLRSLLR